MTPLNKVSAKGRFSHLSPSRSAVIKRAEEAALRTIPSLFVREGHVESTDLPTPYQGDGARAVNSLAAKLVLAMFPPNARFFKLGLARSVLRALENQGIDKDEVIATLAEIEEDVVEFIEATNMRATAFETFRQLLVPGNFLIWINKEGEFTGIGLRNFIVVRDPTGNTLEIIAKQEVSPLTLSDEVRAACGVAPPDEKTQEKNVEVYTRMHRENGKFSLYQEINEKEVPGTRGTYPLDAPPLIPLRWTQVHGEDYGRGMVSEYQGDFNALDDLARDLLKGSAAAAKLIYLLNPSSAMTPKQLSSAKSGDFIRGKREDVNALTLDKYADFRVALGRLGAVESSIAKTFLQASTVQRNAERVTAEEIRFLAQELEDALGGSYSALVQTLQAPVLRRIMAVMTAKGMLPDLPKKDLKITITTGLEALGRGHELQKIRTFVGVAKETVGEEEATLHLKTTPTLEKIAVAVGLNPKEHVKSADEVAAEKQRMAMQSAVEKIGPGVAKELTAQQGQAAQAA